jgi:hypothetical protein
MQYPRPPCGAHRLSTIDAARCTVCQGDDTIGIGSGNDDHDRLDDDLSYDWSDVRHARRLYFCFLRHGLSGAILSGPDQAALVVLVLDTVF